MLYFTAFVDSDVDESSNQTAQANKGRPTTDKFFHVHGL